MLISTVSSCLSHGTIKISAASLRCTADSWSTTKEVSSVPKKRLGRLQGFYRQKVNLYDDHVGQAISKLKELGLWDNTIIVNTSDHE